MAGIVCRRRQSHRQRGDNRDPSDRGISPELAPSRPCWRWRGCIITSSAWATRSRCGLVSWNGEPREVHHFALLIATARAPSIRISRTTTIDDLIAEKMLENTDHKKAVKAVHQGFNQRRGQNHGQDGHLDRAKLSVRRFEAVGINSDVVAKYFTGTATRIQGIGIEVIAERWRGIGAHSRPSRSILNSKRAASINGAMAANNICSIRRRSTSCRSPAASIARRSIASMPTC